MPPNTSKDSLRMQQHCWQPNSKTHTLSSVSNESIHELTDKQKARLQYVSAFVLQNLHKKYCKVNSIESQQAMAILKAGKLDSTNWNTETGTYFKLKQRGTLNSYIASFYDLFED